MLPPIIRIVALDCLFRRHKCYRITGGTPRHRALSNKPGSWFHWAKLQEILVVVLTA